MKVFFLVLLLSLLTSCVDGRTGKFFVCGITEQCK